MKTPESQSVGQRYPRTLNAWLKTDDKGLLKAIQNGQSVLEVAEDLQREHLAVIRRLNDLNLFNFDAGTEEWAEVMGLGLAGVPLRAVIDWCTASPERPTSLELAEMAMGDLRNDFQFAVAHDITVSNIDSVIDLSWLCSQPASVQAGYAAARNAILERTDVVTPMTLKYEVLGIPMPVLKRLWTGYSSTTAAPKARKRRASKTSSFGTTTYKPKPKRYFRRAKTYSRARKSGV